MILEELTLVFNRIYDFIKVEDKITVVTDQISGINAKLDDINIKINQLLSALSNSAPSPWYPYSPVIYDPYKIDITCDTNEGVQKL